MSCCIWCIFLMLGVGSFLCVRRVQMRKKLWRMLSDMTKCTEVALSYVCNNISTPMATQLYIRLRQDLLLAARFLHIQQRLTKTPRQQKKTNRNQTTWATPCSTEFNPPNTKYHPTTNEQWDVCMVWWCGLVVSCECDRPRGDIPAATGCWHHPRVLVYVGIQEHASSHDSWGIDWRLKTDELQTKDWSSHENKTSWVQHRLKPLMTTTTTELGVIW